MAERVLVSLQLVWTANKWYCGWSEEDRGFPRIRKNRTGNSEPVGRIWDYPVHLYDEDRISAKEGARELADGEVPGRQLCV